MENSTQSLDMALTDSMARTIAMYLVDQKRDKPQFEVDNMGKADWCVKKIAEIDAKLQADNDYADEYIDKVNAWRAERRKQAEFAREYFTTHLLPFVKAQLAGSKKKSYKLPHGTAGFRTGAIAYAYDGAKADAGNEQLLDYCKSAAPQYIRIKESVDWAAIKKNLTIDGDTVVDKETGEAIAGMKAVKAPDTFYVKG